MEIIQSIAMVCAGDRSRFGEGVKCKNAWERASRRSAIGKELVKRVIASSTRR
jgi:hypothetical protein